jgi:hypothetical protein
MNGPGDWIFMIMSGDFKKVFTSMFRTGCCILTGFVVTIILIVVFEIGKP